MKIDAVIVSSAAFLVQLLVALFNHYYVYTTSSYIDIRGKISGLQRVLKQLESKVVGAKKEQQKLRDISVVQQQLSDAQGTLFRTTIRSTLLIAVLQFGTFYAISTYFADVVMFKLPFEIPFSFLRMWTHRGITGTDFSELSYLPVYVLSGMLFSRLIRNYSGLEFAADTSTLSSIFSDAMKQAEKMQ
jgi:uncharacterized membrane protein (DUF106 family)